MSRRPGDPSEPLLAEALQRIDIRCLEFEDALRDGGQPRVEDYLDGSSGPERSELLRELLRVEIAWREQAGATSLKDEYAARFAEDSSVLEDIFPDRTDPSGPKVEVATPAAIARYKIVRQIGSGGFGVVFEGYDPELQRRVAVKVRNRPAITSDPDAEQEREEARIIAKLSHPRIVPVYDVGQTDEFPCFIVSALIDGKDLADWARDRDVTTSEAIRVVTAIAEALDYAHGEGIVHRDVKPRNILLDGNDEAFLVDFGLALRSEDVGTGPGYVGTPAYMSPEQARGEGHRVDGRSDLFSLGVVLFELLTGRRPFEGNTSTLLHLIGTDEAPRVTDVRADLPDGFDRVCARALSQRIDDRFQNGREFAEELRFVLETQSTDGKAPDVLRGVVPRGLRAFDMQDADFFLQLLPGPRDRRGLPPLVRQLRDRIESTDAQSTFPAGVVFGPSGCGKSSLIKAGLLPRLTQRVTAIYVEATPDTTEPLLLRGLRKSVDIGEARDLPSAIADLRRRSRAESDEKILLVIDQFEQWLHGNAEPEQSALVAALRHCDGVHVQCLLLVRDDFWFAASRFMRAIEIPIREGLNAFAVGRFDTEHGRRILTAFGQAYDRLPERPSEEQNRFLADAIAELSEGGGVDPVRLAVLAEMMKDREWSPETLRRLGGVSGVGTRFLEETFDPSTIRPEYRPHASAIRAVLRSLLPEADTNIRGAQKSTRSLREAADCSEDTFNSVLSILDRDLRLITPVGVPAGSLDGATDSGAEPAWQLTHDYLVPSIREWTQRHERETLRGRASARLADRTAVWARRRESRQLPSAWEFLNIRLLTRSRDWTELQSRMMGHASRRLRTRWSIIALVTLTVAAGAVLQYEKQRRDQLTQRAGVLIEAFQAAPPPAVPFALPGLSATGSEALRQIDGLLTDSQTSRQRRLRLMCARAALDKPDVRFLIQAIPDAPADECANIVDALARAPAASRDILRKVWQAEPNLDQKARYAITAAHLGEFRLSQEMLAYRSDPVARSTWLETFASWHGRLADLGDLIATLDDSACCSGFCIGTGIAERVRSADRESLTPVLQALSVNRPEADIRSAAVFALAQLGETSHSVSPPSGFSWAIDRPGLTMTRIPAGSFARPLEDRTQTQTVLIGNDFMLATTEVTVAQYQEFVDDPNCPSADKPGDWPGHHEMISIYPDCPVQQVSWSDAVLYCNWLSRQTNRTPCYHRTPKGTWAFDSNANGYRLPTDAEWEYAARGGTSTKWCCGNDEHHLRRYGWFVRNSDYGTSPVGTRIPNRWGLFDMHGNVREWCTDWYASVAAESTLTDPAGPTTGTKKVLHGGTFYHRAESMLSIRRTSEVPDSRNRWNGFRVARNDDRPTEAPPPGPTAE